MLFLPFETTQVLRETSSLQDIGVAKPPHWLTRAFSLVERDDLTVNLDQLTTLQKVGR